MLFEGFVSLVMVILYHDRAKANRIIEAPGIYVVGNEVVKVRVIEA